MRIATRTLFAAAIALLVGACSSGGPTVSGASVLGTRVVNVGDDIDIHIPLDPSGLRGEWRVKSFDSQYIAVAGRPQIVADDAGKRTLLVRGRAYREGSTYIEMEEHLSGEDRLAGKKPGSFRVPIRILP